MYISDYNYTVSISPTKKSFIVEDRTGEPDDDHTFEMPFGALLCERLNKQERGKKRTYPEGTKQIADYMDHFKEMAAQIRGDKLFELVLTDRDKFAESINQLALISSNHANIMWYFNSASKKTESKCGVRELEDLLILDCCKVLEYNIYIAQCPICKKFICSTRPIKYCEQDKARASLQAKRERYQNDEVLRKKKQIYDRLRVADNWHNMKSKVYQDQAGAFLESFSNNHDSMDRDSLIQWLDEQDKISRKRKAAPKAAKGKEGKNNGIC